ncbi:MAG: TonB family protein [Opitutales bacterium]|nr:TonB family protein [Opitutales bacterium]
MTTFIGHVVLISLAGFLGFLPSCEEEKEEVHVFELASASFVPPPPPVYKPEPKPVPPVVTPVKPKIITQPKPKPVTQKPKPKPIVKPKPTSPPIVKPKPKTVIPKPKTISFNQFQKKHPVQSPPKVSSEPVKQVPRVRIDPKKFALPQITISNPASQSTQVDPTILNRYLGAVKSKLEAVWRRLQSESNIAIEGEAFLSFKISSNGTLISPTISRSSGNQALDRLVIQVSKSVGNLGRPPGGKLSSSLEIPFRVR